jgi:hypothetical protein
VCREGLRALRTAFPAARSAADASIHSLDLRRTAYGGRLPSAHRLGSFVARLLGLQELRTDADALQHVVCGVMAGGCAVAAGLRRVRLGVADRGGTVSADLSRLLQNAFPSLKVGLGGTWVGIMGQRGFCLWSSGRYRTSLLHACAC